MWPNVGSAWVQCRHSVGLARPSKGSAHIQHGSSAGVGTARVQRGVGLAWVHIGKHKSRSCSARVGRSIGNTCSQRTATMRLRRARGLREGPAAEVNRGVRRTCGFADCRRTADLRLRGLPLRLVRARWNWKNRARVPSSGTVGCRIMFCPRGSDGGGSCGNWLRSQCSLA